MDVARDSQSIAAALNHSALNIGNSLGALLGGILVASLSNYLSAIMPGYWQLVLGVLFVLVILFLKGGVAGAVARLLAAGRRS